MYGEKALELRSREDNDGANGWGHGSDLTLIRSSVGRYSSGREALDAGI